VVLTGVVHDLADLGPGSWFVAVGKFDGVHRGHQAVLAAMVRAAARSGARAAALTFEPHPMEVLRPGSMPPLLATREDRARLLLATGVERVVELRFDAEMANVPAEDFVAELLVRRGGVRRLYAGPDWRFGRGGAGTVETARRVGAPLGLEVRVQPPRTWKGAPISSSRIREALLAGRVGEGRDMLGRVYDVPGTVVHGQGRGRDVGFPTANVEVGHRLVLPGAGVYAVRVQVDGTWRPGVANLGTRPTFAAGGPQVLEAHIFDFAGNLSGAWVRVAFAARLRGEHRFSGVEALRAQIRRDAARARAYLGVRDGP
jgi:riboflavin kinase/FMN adenylyltransferase